MSGIQSVTEDPRGYPAVWRKSTYSNPNGECVELAELADGQVAIRNSRAPSDGTLVFTRGEIHAFLRGIHDGEFSYLAD